MNPKTGRWLKGDLDTLGRGSHKDSRCEDIKNICQDIADDVNPT